MYQKGVELRELKKGNELSSKQYLTKQGQFIISKIDARNGAMGIVPDSLDGAVVTGDFLLFNFNKTIIDPNFFNYYTRLISFDIACKRCSEGSTNRVRLKVDKLLNFEITLPTLPEQQRIVSKIESVKNKLERIKELRAEQAKNINNLLCSKYTELIEHAAWLPMCEVAPIHRRQVEINFEETYFEIGVRSFG